MNIRITKTKEKKTHPSTEKLGFGKYFTDHMFRMDYDAEQGWHDPQIVPYGPIVLSPAATVFHYGQETFEGMKAYKNAEDILLFRPEKNFARLNQSNERLAIPPLDAAFCLEALQELIRLDQDWIPTAEGTSLYIRPFCIATQPFLGVHPSEQYSFYIILSPSGSYYETGLNPVSIYVEDHYVRAVPGGMGYAKTGGNYAASLLAQQKEEAAGYSQVLWLDGVERKYVEEVGSMNIFFKIKGEVITPALNGSILNGITRMSIIELLHSWEIPVQERKISVEELFQAHAQGELEEVFGAGTAAVVSPIGKLGWKDQSATIHNGKIGDITQKIYDTLTGIQYGELEDPFGWTLRFH